MFKGRNILKSFVSTFFIMVMLAISAFCVVRVVQKPLNYQDIKIKLNGKTITPKDVKGNIVEPFGIEGTVYLPVRALSEAIGFDVEWDGKSNTVIVSSKTASKVKEGMYIVGKDIKSGTYKLTSTSTYSAYWARKTNASGELSSIIANNNFKNVTYVTVKDGEYLELVRCIGELQ